MLINRPERREKAVGICREEGGRDYYCCAVREESVSVEKRTRGGGLTDGSGTIYQTISDPCTQSTSLTDSRLQRIVLQQSQHSRHKFLIVLFLQSISDESEKIQK